MVIVNVFTMVLSLVLENNQPRQIEDLPLCLPPALLHTLGRGESVVWLRIRLAVPAPFRALKDVHILDSYEHNPLEGRPQGDPSHQSQQRHPDGSFPAPYPSARNS